MAIPKKALLGAALLLALGLGALTGTGLPTLLHGASPIPAAYADGDCSDNNPPPPGVIPCDTPTPTPPPK